MHFYKPNAVLTIENTTLEVSIKRRQDPRNTNDAGLQNLRFFFIGNAVTPKVLPIFINLGDKGIINVDDGNIVGEFIFFDVQRTRFKALEQILGESFSGYLIPSKQYDESQWA